LKSQDKAMVHSRRLGKVFIIKKKPDFDPYYGFPEIGIRSFNKPWANFNRRKRKLVKNKHSIDLFANK